MNKVQSALRLIKNKTSDFISTGKKLEIIPPVEKQKEVMPVEKTPAGKQTCKKSQKDIKLSFIRHIASRIYKDKLLREIWDSRQLNYNKVLKTNYWETFPDNSDYSPILVPEPGFPVNEASLRIFGKEIILETEMPVRTENDISNKEKYITAAGILIIHDPVKKSEYGDIMILPACFDKQLINKSGPLTLKASYGQRLMILIHFYSRRQIFIVLVTLDKDGKPVIYSRQIKNEYLERVL